MMLGRSHESIYGPIWSAAKWLELCPVGTIIRNGCDHRAPAGEGTHLIKVDLGRGTDPGNTEWLPCNPSGSWRVPDDPWYPLRARDVFLPVQVVKRGKGEE